MLFKFQAKLTSPVDYSLLKSYRAADHSKVQTGTLKTFYAIDLEMEGTSMNHWAELLQDYLESYNSISVEICFRITTNQLLWKICCLVIESKLVVLLKISCILSWKLLINLTAFISFLFQLHHWDQVVYQVGHLCLALPVAVPWGPTITNRASTKPWLLWLTSGTGSSVGRSKRSQGNSPFWNRGKSRLY